MTAQLTRAVLALVPITALLAVAIAMFARRRHASSFLLLLGAGFLVVVVLTHVCEALHLLSWMHWGEPHSAGHYLDLSSAAFGIALISVGTLLAIRRRM